jgi:Glycogen recognition site of AMP-activated protein kinase
VSGGDDLRRDDGDALVDALARLGKRTPAARATLADEVMRQVAVRPRPRARSWWAALTATRSLSFTFTFRFSQLAVGAALAAVVGGAWWLRAPSPRAHVALAHEPTAVIDAPAGTVLVRFQLAAADARAVTVAGDFNGWRPDATPLARSPAGVWTATVPLAAGRWSYSFIVDGKWITDPAADTTRDDGFGGKNAVLRVGS